MLRPILRLIAVTAMLLVASSYTFAGNSDRFQTNHDIHVETNDNPNDVTCFRCSIYVRGEVRGDVTAIGGNIVLESGAQVHGDTTSIMGDIQLGADTKRRPGCNGCGRRGPPRFPGGGQRAMSQLWRVKAGWPWYSWCR